MSASRGRDLSHLGWVLELLLRSMRLHLVGNQADVSLRARFGRDPFGIQSHCPRPSPAALNSIFASVFRTDRFFHTTNGRGSCLAPCDRKPWARLSTASQQDICLSVKRLPGTSAFLAVWKSPRKISPS